MGRNHAKWVLPAILCSLLIWAPVTVSPLAVAGASNAQVQDLTSAVVTFNAPFTILDANYGTAYPFQFVFGNGYPGDPVNTDVEIVLGRDGDLSQVYACQGGQMVLVDHGSGAITPQTALIKVLYNSTDKAYRIGISESSNSFIKLEICVGKGISCSVEEGTPLLFQLTSDASSSTKKLPFRHAPADHVHDPLAVPLIELN